MKYYKVIKENFLWEVNAVLTDQEKEEYVPVDDVFKKHDHDEYVSASIVENSPEYFMRVYKVDLINRTIYQIKEDAKKAIGKMYKA